MKNVKDIRDELNMLKAILSHQMRVWNQLHDTGSKKDHFRGPAYYLNDIKEMDSQAERIQGAVSNGISPAKSTCLHPTKNTI